MGTNLRLHPSQLALQINHRSWGDFLVDQYLTEGRSTFLARSAWC